MPIVTCRCGDVSNYRYNGIAVCENCYNKNDALEKEGENGN